MNRNMDLVRNILIFLEEQPNGFAPSSIEIPNYSDEEIGYHVYLMAQADLVQGYDNTTMACTSPCWHATTMTWTGHEFLENTKDPEMWQQAKDAVEKVGGASFSVWTGVLTKIVMQNLGIES